MKLRSIFLPLIMVALSIASPATFADGEHPMTEGVVKKINTDTGKITIKHGPITNLDMPPMSMVFGVENKAMLDGLSKGDNVKFYVIDKDGKMIIQEIESE